MKNEIGLKTPITVNGQSVRTLYYDFDCFDSDAFFRANDRALSKMKQGRAGAVELDYALHLCFAQEAVVIEMPELDINDLERMKGPDLLKLLAAGRDFFMSDSENPPEDESTQNSSNPCSEDMQENSQPVSQTSGDSPSSYS